MACATPIVCSDILGFRDVVKNEREALMVPRDDQGALADGLVRLLDDETLRHRLGATGREVAQLYAWSRVTEQVLAVYADVLNLAAAPAA
jgi:glycosyltransferase involved in cell wall biosynthesis